MASYGYTRDVEQRLRKQKPAINLPALQRSLRESATSQSVSRGLINRPAEQFATPLRSQPQASPIRTTAERSYPSVTRGGAVSPGLYQEAPGAGPSAVMNNRDISSLAEKYSQEARKTEITPLADRLATYQRGIAANQDLQEAREAESIGMSQEGYRQFKERKSLGRKGAAELAGQRMSIADVAAGRQAEYEAGAPQRQAQQIQNEIYKRMAATSDPGEIERLAQTLLAMQGKQSDAQYQFQVVPGGQEEFGDFGALRTLPSQFYRTNPRTGKAEIISGGQAPAPTKTTDIPDGTYNVPGVGTVTVRGGIVYDQNGKIIEE